MPNQGRIVLLGAAGVMPVAGVAWQVMQYLEGLQRLGHDVFYLEDTERWPYDPIAETKCADARNAIAYVAQLMARCGLEDAWAYRDAAENGALHGMSERGLEQTLASADMLINLSGATVLREEHLRIPVRVYLETDPVTPQIEVAQGREFTVELLATHTHHFTYGANFGAADCGVPLGRFRYHTTLPPVILDWWWATQGASPATLDDRPFTTIANWRQRRNIEWNGRTLSWSKDIQFKRFMELPQRVDLPIELALALRDEQTIAQLRAAGWRFRPAGPLSKDIDAYRSYIASSAGEFSVAKEQNVVLRSGWFSDRTATYLAAGRPAIVQDTGFGCVLPTGEGLLPFSTLEEAEAAFAAVAADYPRHCQAARDIAGQYLRAETVLTELLETAAAHPVAA